MKYLQLTTLLAALFVLGGIAQAGEKEKTIEGTITCAKCELGEADACSDVVTADGEKYYLMQDGNAKTDAHQCRGTAKVTVTGKMEDRDGKNYVIVSEIEKEKS